MNVPTFMSIFCSVSKLQQMSSICVYILSWLPRFISIDIWVVSLWWSKVCDIQFLQLINELQFCKWRFHAIKMLLVLGWKWNGNAIKGLQSYCKAIRFVLTPTKSAISTFTIFGILLYLIPSNLQEKTFFALKEYF